VSRPRHGISRADLNAFMDRLFAGAVPVQAPTSRQVTFGRACFAASTNIGDLIELILDDRLSWKGRLLGGRRYTDLLVDADEVTRVLQEAAPPRRSLTKKEIHARPEPGRRYRLDPGWAVGGDRRILSDDPEKVAARDPGQLRSVQEPVRHRH